MGPCPLLGRVSALCLCLLQEQIELPEVPSEPLPEKKPGTPRYPLWETVNSAKQSALAVGSCPLPSSVGELLAPAQAEPWPHPGVGNLGRADPCWERRVLKVGARKSGLAVQALLGQRPLNVPVLGRPSP